MNETILFTVSLLLSMLVGFLCGILFCNNKQRGLDNTSNGISKSLGECDKLAGEINDTAGEVEQLNNDLQESADSIGRISAILQKYGETTENNKNVE